MATINLGAIKFNWKGAYNNGTTYAVDDVVSSGGNSYVCIQAHSNQAVGNATAYWNIMSTAGTNGTNGSNGSNGTDLSTTLTTQGDILYRDGSGLQRLAKGSANQELRINSGATAPEWYTPSGGGGGMQSIQVFTSTGSSTYTKPSGVTKVKVIVTGAGGGSDAINEVYYHAGGCGAGGGGGGTAIDFIDLSGVATVNVTVGTAGVNGYETGGTNYEGTTGGTSSFGSYCTGNGGVKSQSYSYSQGGNGGTASSGFINITGGGGMSQTASRESSSYQAGGMSGGGTFWGSGSTGGGYSAGSATGGAFGGGGGGRSSGNNAGQQPKNGVVYVEEYA